MKHWEKAGRPRSTGWCTLWPKIIDRENHSSPEDQPLSFEKIPMEIKGKKCETLLIDIQHLFTSLWSNCAVNRLSGDLYCKEYGASTHRRYFHSGMPLLWRPYMKTDCDIDLLFYWKCYLKPSANAKISQSQEQRENPDVNLTDWLSEWRAKRDDSNNNNYDSGIYLSVTENNDMLGVLPRLFDTMWRPCCFLFNLNLLYAIVLFFCFVFILIWYI